MNIVNNGAGEIRVWRVGEAIHANIPRSVVKEPPVIDHRPGAQAPVPDRGQLEDLALNILNLFVPPEQGAAGRDRAREMSSRPLLRVRGALSRSVRARVHRPAAGRRRRDR